MTSLWTARRSRRMWRNERPLSKRERHDLSREDGDGQQLNEASAQLEDWADMQCS